MYWRLRYETPIGRYVKMYHTRRNYVRGEKRRPREKKTGKAAAECNQKSREEKIQLLMMNNFRKGDYYATLTYKRQKRPADMREAKLHMATAIQRIRREYRKKGYELKYICNIEKGSKGGWHIHLVLNRIPDTDLILDRAWREQHGGVHTTMLYEEGGFRDLASYFAKRPEETEPEKPEHGYSRSRNLAMPKAKKEQMARSTWPKKIKVPKGYILDKESVFDGEDRLGFPYCRYVLLCTEERRKELARSTPVRGSLKRRAEEMPQESGLCPGGKKRRKGTGHRDGTG